MKQTRHLIVLTGVVIFGLGLVLGSFLADLDASDAMQRGYTHGYIDALTGAHDQAYWHHVTTKQHVEPGDILSDGGFGAMQIYRIEDRR